MKLYGYWTSNPQKVRLALEEIGQPYDYEYLDLSQRAHKTLDFRGLSPRQKVPVLIDGEAVLWESGAALLYLSQKAPHLWPADDMGRGQALSWLFFEASAFNEVARVYFFNRLVLPRLGKTGDEERVAQAAKKIKPFLGLLEEHLTASQAYLLGDFSLVDCAYAPFLPVLDLEGFSGLQAWRDRLMARDAWTKAEFSYGIYGEK